MLALRQCIGFPEPPRGTTSSLSVPPLGLQVMNECSRISHDDGECHPRQLLLSTVSQFGELARPTSIRGLVGNLFELLDEILVDPVTGLVRG